MEGFEEELDAQGYRFPAGIDEAGRGPLAGPLVAAAVILPSNLRIPGLDDSKRLTPVKREQFFESISACAAVGIGIVSPPEIDRLNIFNATRRAMVLAVQDLPRQSDFLLIDGNAPIPLPIPQWTIIKGDRRCASIAAASIIAKVTRDRMMIALHHCHPQYNFHIHKGYATRDHCEAIRIHGPCEAHRKSFRRVREHLFFGKKI
ncbi:MAG: ribonuclease HII [Deltaproteobacteria bacterium]|nr:ribonuclease HII [Deltaproteobacteria bacterium]MBW2308404.1 ribonuclease HII [Deltaproteobacteria bacterium]